MSTYRKNEEELDTQALPNCPPFLERYFSYLSIFDNKKINTTLDYFPVLREFCQYFHYIHRFHIKPSTKDAHKDLDITAMKLSELCVLTQDHLEGYLCFLDTVAGNRSGTLRKKILILRNFYRYIERNADELGVRLEHGNPIRFIAIPKANEAVPLTLSLKQIQTLINSTTGKTALRDKAMILLFATTAIKTSELINLNYGDLQGNALLIRNGKTNHTVYLTEGCLTCLQEYLAEEPECDNPDRPLFTPDKSSRRMTARAIQARIAKAADKAGLGNLNVTAKTLRDSAASLMFSSSNKADQDSIRYYLGCISPYSMRQFTKPSTSAIEQTIKKTKLDTLY